MNTLERLQGMVNKPYLYRNEEVVVLGYCEGTGDDGDEVEIYLNNGKTLVFNYINLPAKLEQFKPVTTQVIVLANKRLDAVSTVNPGVIQKLRDTVLQQIEGRQILSGACQPGEAGIPGCEHADKPCQNGTGVS